MIEPLHRELTGSGFVVLGINIQESRETVAAWAGEHDVTLPLLLDHDGEVTRRYGVVATPTAVLVDREGRLVGRAIGARDWSTPRARALLSRLVAGPAR